MKKGGYLLAALCFVASLCCSACSQIDSGSAAETVLTTATTTVATTATTETTTTAVTTTTAPVEELKTVGEAPADGDAFTVHLTNETGLAIIEFAISYNDEDETDNLLEDDFEDSEERVLYYPMPENGSDEDTYQIAVTLEDNTTLELHDFPFGDIEEGTIQYDEERNLVYLTYTSLETDEEVDTLDAEITIAQAAEESAVDEPVTSYAQTEPATQPQTQPATTQAPVVETTAATTAPVETTVPVQTTVAVETTADPNEGCIGDEGLFY